MIICTIRKESVRYNSAYKSAYNLVHLSPRKAKITFPGILNCVKSNESADLCIIRKSYADSFADLYADSYSKSFVLTAPKRRAKLAPLLF
jgi:hypothetical protein